MKNLLEGLKSYQIGNKITKIHLQNVGMAFYSSSLKNVTFMRFEVIFEYPAGVMVVGVQGFLKWGE